MRRHDRVLAWGTVAILLVMLAFTVQALMHAGASAEAQTQRLLENAQRLLRVRLTGLVHELEQDLRQEAATLDEWGATPESGRLLERWRPLLARHWSLAMVALADEQGNEVALYRDGDAYYMRETHEGSREHPSEVRRIPAQKGGDEHTVTQLTEEHDPRTGLWFSKALEDVRDEPTWTVHIPPKEDSPTRLQLSLLLRDREGKGPLRILMFEADPSRSSWLDHHTLPFDEVAMILMDAEGRLLGMPDGRSAHDLREAASAAVEHWAIAWPRSSFPVEAGERHFLALVSPYALNGQTLYTAVVMDAGIESPFIVQERRTLLVLTGLILLLSALLGVIWSRRRRADTILRRQEQHSRSQELRLAKALGEREVLNREVHHRVKNNLQVVSSLLNLQASKLEDGPVRDEFLRGKHRIDTMALVHHKLYGLRDLRKVDLDLFFTSLAGALAEMHRPLSRTVSCEVDTQGLHGDQDTAIGLGIILCELLANAYRHAFPYATGGHIDIQVQVVEGDLHRLVVKDNGKGLPDGHAHGAGKLGLEIVEALAEQLDGSFHSRSNGGTTFEVLFRMTAQDGSAKDVIAQADGTYKPSADL